MISHKAMIAKLTAAGYQVTRQPNGMTTISRDGWDETYITLRAAYNDKFNL